MIKIFEDLKVLQRSEKIPDGWFVGNVFESEGKIWRCVLPMKFCDTENIRALNAFVDDILRDSFGRILKSIKEAEDEKVFLFVLRSEDVPKEYIQIARAVCMDGKTFLIAALEKWMVLSGVEYENLESVVFNYASKVFPGVKIEMWAS